MKMRLTAIYEYDTGADDTETLNAYGTADPAECLAIEGENISAQGGVTEFIFNTDLYTDSWVLEVVPR
ncbi:MAG TPA: hypothetical protein VEM32_11540 [Geobacteraceae bacterium]|nr:hypothetical protein [Geobacteraceae bacterium]